MKKIKLYGLLVGGLLFLMSSCLGDGNRSNIDDWTMGNAQIAAFSLFSDSVKGLSVVNFTIDQLNSKIYNKDSMPYGTVLDKKVFCDLRWDNGTIGVLGVLFVSQATGDSVWWSSNADSIDFSTPVTITVYPYDGVSTKVYEVKLNVHQIDPDKMVWYKYADLISGKISDNIKVIPYKGSYYMYILENGEYRLYESDKSEYNNWSEVLLSGFPDNAVISQLTEFEGDLYVVSEDGVLYCSDAEYNTAGGQSWSSVEGAPSIKSLLGCLPENFVTGRVPVLSGIAVEDGTMSFVCLNKNKEWKTGSAVPEKFSVSGFGSFGYEAMYHPRLVVATGRDLRDNLSNNVWSTMDGLSWILLSNSGTAYSPREGAALFYYDNRFFLIGGIDGSGAALKDIFYSKDQGINWVRDEVSAEEDNEDSETEVSKIYIMPEEYAGRGFSSVIVDEKNNILLFGGKEGKDTNVLNEIWCGRINRLAFGKE